MMLESDHATSHTTLDGLFRHVVGYSPKFAFLPLEEMIEVLRSPLEKSKDVFVGGSIDTNLGLLVLIRGDLQKFPVPLSMFQPSGRAAPDFEKFSIGDYGHTLSFGDYEATADVVLWELDREYRKEAKAKMRETDEGFGASLRRLRKQRGLSQSDFPNVARKTVSRIENGEVEKPHGVTLNRIAKALGVAPEDVESY